MMNKIYGTDPNASSSRAGFDVLTASTGAEALDILAGQTIPIVLLDLKMPGMDGMEVLARIREFDEPILVIVITGFATVETAIEAMKQGAYDFIPKPFEPEQLRIVVNRAAEKLRLTRDARNLELERNRTLSDLHTEKSRLHTILESLPNGVGVVNSEGQVVLMNPAFLHHLDLERGYKGGQTDRRIHHGQPSFAILSEKFPRAGMWTMRISPLTNLRYPMKNFSRRGVARSWVNATSVWVRW